MNVKLSSFWYVSVRYIKANCQYYSQSNSRIIDKKQNRFFKNYTFKPNAFKMYNFLAVKSAATKLWSKNNANQKRSVVPKNRDHLSEKFCGESVFLNWSYFLNWRRLLALWRLMSIKRSCILKQTWSFQLQSCKSMYDLLVDTRD